jgi:repressor LexA
MDIGKLINQRRLALDLTLEEVGNAVGVSKSTVKKWEDGFISNMKRDKIAQLASVLKLSPVSLITGELIEESNKPLPNNIIPLKKIRSVPIVGSIACGTPILAEQNYISSVLLPDNVNADFSLICRGDSMIDANIQDGDIVFIKETPMVENGEIAAVVIGEEATLKKVYYQNDTVTLLPANSTYEPLVYKKEEINDIRICGKAVAVLRHIQ